jgi:CheY-like chemotaxis protein
MVAEELRGRGFNIIEAQNAHEALTLLQSRVPVDLVFSDVQLPGAIDGLILARLVRKMRPELKIILASGHLVSGSSLEGADAFFSKPYDLGGVLTQIEQLLGGLHR